MATVTLRNLCKSYGNGHHAVRDVSLEVGDGEFVVLVGPSGCGKSTTLRLIAGLEDITSGTLQIDGVTVNDLAPAARNIAMVFQNYALYPHMSVRDNIAFALKMAGHAKAEIARRVADTAALLQLDGVLDRRPAMLSGGQRQRVALGRAIVREPKVFLMDEPLSNLDAQLRTEMRASIARLHRRLGVTTVYVTHDQVEAMTLGHRIVVMRDGVVQQIATPLDLYRHPNNRFVAGFIGSPAMSFLEARWQTGALHGDGVHIALPAALRERWRLADAQPVWLGLRPEQLRLAATATPVTSARVTGRADIVEALGAETVVNVAIGNGHHLLARLPGHLAVSVGDTLELAFDPAELHVFDHDSEVNLGLG